MTPRRPFGGELMRAVQQAEAELATRRIPGARYPIIGEWSANVAYLLAHQIAEGGGCWVSCSYCKTWEPVNLARLVIKLNPLASLWNRHPACPKCKAPMCFHAVHAPNARVIPLQTDDPRYTDDLHRAWLREKRRLANWPPERGG